MATTANRNLTPPDIAKRYGVTPGKVIAWIRSGELHALNLATRGCRRPRFSISPEALATFEASRAVVPEVSPVRKCRTSIGGKDYFQD